MDGRPLYQLWYACDSLMHLQFQKGHSIVSGVFGIWFYCWHPQKQPKSFRGAQAGAWLLRISLRTVYTSLLKDFSHHITGWWHLLLPAGTSGAWGQKISCSRPNTVFSTRWMVTKYLKRERQWEEKGGSSTLSSKYPTLPLAHSDCPINIHWVNSFDMQQTV